MVESTKFPKFLMLRMGLTLRYWIIAIGYPYFVGAGEATVYEFSRSIGTITFISDLLMRDGFAFQAIHSDAYTSFGSSGGGLYDENGTLIGITTWGTERESIAIKLDTLEELRFEFLSCSKNEYLEEGYCIPYCGPYEVLGDDHICYGSCTSFYCESEIPAADDPNCPSGYILGNDGYCHLPCGSSFTYCPGVDSYCFEDNCVECSPGETLYKDGLCYPE